MIAGPWEYCHHHHQVTVVLDPDEPETRYYCGCPVEETP